MMEGVWDSSELGQTCGKGQARNGKLIRTARAKSDTIAACFRQSFSLAWLRRAFAGESLNLLVNASASFSAAIVQQLAAVQAIHHLARVAKMKRSGIEWDLVI